MTTGDTCREPRGNKPGFPIGREISAALSNRTRKISIRAAIGDDTGRHHYPSARDSISTLELPEMDLFLPVPVKMTAIYVKEKNEIIFNSLMYL